MGSKDRKAIANLCYSYFRISKVASRTTLEAQMAMGLFLMNSSHNVYLEVLDQELNADITLPLNEKLGKLGITLTQVFPFATLLSKDLNVDAYAQSFLEQPSLFLRIRPQKIAAVTAALEAKNITFERVEHCIELANNTALHALVGLNANFVVQDSSSQQVLDYLTTYKSVGQPTLWDCCAASGGKAILAYDILQGNVKITITDIRENILKAAKHRLMEASVPVIASKVLDLTNAVSNEALEKFDIVVCDAPCTGSGTWARTPEQLHFFSQKILITYSSRQKKIVLHAFEQLKEGGIFFYITCSVFEAENEAVVNFILGETSAIVLHQTYILGYEDQADSLFVTVLSKPAT